MNRLAARECGVCGNALNLVSWQPCCVQVRGWREIRKWHADFKDKRLAALLDRLKILVNLRKTQGKKTRRFPSRDVT